MLQPIELGLFEFPVKDLISFESPAAFAAWLVEQRTVDYPAFLERYLDRFDTAEQDELAACLKERGDYFRRTDLDRCFKVADLIKYMAELTGNELHLALGLRAEGNAYALALGECQSGVDCYDEAAKIYRRYGRKLEEAWSQIGKIFALANLGRTDEALQVGGWARGVFRELEQWLPLAEVTVNMAIIYGQRGEDRQALELLEQAHELYLEHQGENSDKRLQVVDMNRSILLRNLGRFEEAIAINKRLIEVELGRANFIGAAKSQHNLAVTYFILGRYNEALALLDAAQWGFEQDGRRRDAILVELFIANCLLQLRRFNEAIEKCCHARKNLDSPHHIAESYVHEARALIGIERYEEAFYSLTMARNLFEQEGNLSAQADTDLYIAKVLLVQGQPEKAFGLAEKSLGIFQDYNLPLGFVQAQLVCAQAALALNRPVKAREMVAAVLDSAKNHNFPTFAYQGFHLAGTIAARSGDFRQALVEWEAGIGILEQMYSHMMLEYRVDFAEDKMRLYEDVVALNICQNNADVALAFAERAKSRALHDLLAYRLDLRIEARSVADEALVNKILALRDERNHLYRRWHSDKQLGSTEDIASELTSKQSTGQQLMALEKQITASWHKLLIRNAEYAQDATLWQIQAEPVQPFLDEKDVLVEYFAVREQLVCFVIDADSIRAVSLDVTVKQVQQLLQLVGLNLRAVPHSAPARLPILTKNIQGILQRLYQNLIEPISAYLNGFEKLIIVPHGPLHYLPFQALFDGQRYLIEDFEVSYLPSSSLLRYCQTAETAAAGVLALGYSSDGRLPHAAEEAENIARKWGGRVRIEQEATLANLHSCADRYRVLHLATHGEFRADNPLFSGLILADGWLTTLDIFDLRLKASLVTLSACQTGRSVVGGGDELLGLLRAFLAAGAASLVCTYWAVEDRMTAVIMDEFYQNLADGQTKGAALRWAQLNHIDQHPYFWSPFFLVGDTGPL